MLPGSRRPHRSTTSSTTSWGSRRRRKKKSLSAVLRRTGSCPLFTAWAVRMIAEAWA